MKRFIIVFMLVSFNLSATPNCEIYKENENCYEGCKMAMKAISYKQGAYLSQKYFDKSIDLCPTLAYSYMEKAVPYLKRGAFIKWKKLIDKAVALSPQEYLGYRGWCRLQFLRDYEGAISDIERLKEMVNYDIGYCQTGDYHLNIALALCYKETGDLNKASLLFQEQLNADDHHQGFYDYYHFGVLEYERENYQQAIAHLEKQIKINDYLGETYYFLAMAKKQLGQYDEYIQNLDKAEEYYRKGKCRTDVYAETIDKIYLLDILEEKEKINHN